MSAFAWVIYALVVSVVLSAAALAAEAALRAGRASGRWVWLAALAGGVLLPLWARLRPPAASAPEALFAPVLEFAPVLLAPVSAAAGSPVPWAALAWGSASALTVLVLLLSQRALARARRSWPERDVDGTRVLVSRDLGPAVVGVVQPRIVVPEWLLSLDGALRRLMLRHEEEHRAAGDSRLLLGALVLCAAMPWNVVLWWQLHRLRVAMELDCDERVLARDADPAAYGRLLLEVGRRRTERHLLATAFAEPRVLLERRVRALLAWPRARRPLSAFGLGGVALLLLGFAYATPDPLARAQQPAPATPAQLVDAVIEKVTGEVGTMTSPAVPVMVQDTPPPVEKPRFTPMTKRPELANPPEVQRALVQHYPPLLKDAGIGGDAVVWLFIDETGTVQKLQLSKSSGYPAMDEAALKVMAVARFTPAENRGTPVAVWVEMPVQFRAAAKTGTATPPRTLDDRSLLQELGAVPAEGYPARALTNVAVIAEEIKRAYPPLLQEARIGGTVTVSIFVDPQGAPTRLQVWKGSGYPALDQAGLKVAASMRFAPADSATWVQVPIVFAPPGDPSRGPTFTPMTQRPELKNPSAVQSALIAAYPPQLRDAGIGGTPVVWVFVDENGIVQKTQLSKSSGFVALDEAALKVATAFEFTPARNRDRAVAVWIEVPVQFAAK